jgi:hypothetical protein
MLFFISMTAVIDRLAQSLLLLRHARHQPLRKRNNRRRGQSVRRIIVKL